MLYVWIWRQCHNLNVILAWFVSDVVIYSCTVSCVIDAVCGPYR